MFTIRHLLSTLYIFFLHPTFKTPFFFYLPLVSCHCYASFSSNYALTHNCKGSGRGAKWGHYTLCRIAIVRVVSTIIILLMLIRELRMEMDWIFQYPI